MVSETGQTNWQAGLGFLHPADMEEKRKSRKLEAWLQQENLNVAITGICDVFDINAEKGLATAGNEIIPGGAKPAGLQVKRYKTYARCLMTQPSMQLLLQLPTIIMPE